MSHLTVEPAANGQSTTRRSPPAVERAQGPRAESEPESDRLVPVMLVAAGPHGLVRLQRAVGNAAVARALRPARPVAVQRDCAPGYRDCGPCREAAASDEQVVQRDDGAEGDPALVAQLERELDQMERDAAQNDDLYLRAYASRVALLLRVHPVLTSQQQLDDFIGQKHQFASTEMDTLNALGPAGAELAMAVAPKGFPLTWSGRVHAALTLGVEPKAVFDESVQQLEALRGQADGLPPKIMEKGLPVPLAEVGGLAVFPLRATHLALAAGSPVGDYARACMRFAQFRFLANFALVWEGIANETAAAVADGTVVAPVRDHDAFVKDKGRILRELPARARERMSMTDEELAAIQRDALNLGDAALVAGAIGGLAGLLGILDGWNTGAQLFDTALKVADNLLAGSGDGERISAAFTWMIEAGYASDAALEALRNLVASGPEMLKEIGIILVLQMIPFVNVAVDVYLLLKLGADVVGLVGEIGGAFGDVVAARTVVALQRAAGRLARALASGGVQILTVLATLGVAKGVKALRARTERIRAAEPTLSDEAAMRKAMREAPAEERAALEEQALSPWERSLNDETKELLRGRPELRQVFRGASEQTRRVLTHCASPCVPPGATAAEIARVDALLARMRTLSTADELVLNEYFYANRPDLPRAIARVEAASGPGHLRGLLRDDARTRSGLSSHAAAGLDPPGHGLPGNWGNPKSRSYGHAFSEHGAHLEAKEFRDRAMSTRSKGRKVPDAQFYDNALIVEAERRAGAAPGVYEFDMGRPVGRMFLPDGTLVSDLQRVRVVRSADGSLDTAFPIP